MTGKWYLDCVATAAPTYSEKHASMLSAAAEAMRPPDTVLTVHALGASKTIALSRARSLVRRMSREKWAMERLRFEVDAEGRGEAVYAIDAGGYPLHFYVVSHFEPGHARQGRIADTYFDGVGALMDGPPDFERLDRERGEMAKLWDGRSDASCLGWTLANRSLRYFDLVVDALAAGRQPDLDILSEGGGYIFRNAGFYGNGRFGTACFLGRRPDHPLADPFHQELFGLYLWRLFAVDLAEAMALHRNPDAVPLDGAIKRYLGIGNGSGLGMVAVLVRWPQWLDAWVGLRELGIAAMRQRFVDPAGPELARLAELLARCRDFHIAHVADVTDHGEPPLAIAKGLDLAIAEVRALQAGGAGEYPNGRPLLDGFCHWAISNLSKETSEQILALLPELDPDLVVALDAAMRPAMQRLEDIDPGQRLGDLRATLTEVYGWALSIDRSDPDTRRHFWYRSTDNNEQRRGDRFADPPAGRETFVDVAGWIQRLDQVIAGRSPDERVGELLFAEPELRQIVERVQSLAGRPYGDICGNLIAADFLPLYVIRAFLGFLGLEVSKPKNFRWVAGVFLQGAPWPDDLANAAEPDWIFPARPDRDTKP